MSSMFCVWMGDNKRGEHPWESYVLAMLYEYGKRLLYMLDECSPATSLLSVFSSAP